MATTMDPNLSAPAVPSPRTKKARLDTTNDVVTITCTDDGSKHTSSLSVACMSTLIAAMLEDLDDGSTDIPVSGVDGPTMVLVLGFCHRAQALQLQVGLDLTSSQLRDAVFDDGAGMTVPMLQKVIKAANFLGIESLLDAACAVAACAIEKTQLPQLTMVAAEP